MTLGIKMKSYRKIRDYIKRKGFDYVGYNAELK
jgi:hypothetical protein